MVNYNHQIVKANVRVLYFHLRLNLYFIKNLNENGSLTEKEIYVYKRSGINNNE